VPTTTPTTLDRLTYRYPAALVDAVVSHDRGRSLEAVKSVTVSEDFFQGHFPGQPVMPGVLMIESLAQAAAILLLNRDGEPEETRASLRGVDGVKFRRQIVPGDPPASPARRSSTSRSLPRLRWSWRSSATASRSTRPRSSIPRP
jgi:3-hydroxymyristoyl/3-hydroxydecanoyl-(acyl carrier protein) dehydratase